MKKYYKLIVFVLIAAYLVPLSSLSWALELPENQDSSPSSNYSVERFLLSQNQVENLILNQNNLLQLQASNAFLSGAIQTANGQAFFESKDEFLSLTLPSGQNWKIDILAEAVYSGNISNGNWTFLKINPESYTQIIEQLLNEAKKLKRFSVSQNQLDDLNEFISLVEDQQFTYGTRIYGSNGLQSIRYLDSNNRLLAFSKYNKTTGLLSQLNWFGNGHLDEIFYFDASGNLSSIFSFSIRNSIESIVDFTYDISGNLLSSLMWLDENRSQLEELSFYSPDYTRGLTLRATDDHNGIILEIVDLTSGSLGSILKIHTFLDTTDLSSLFTLEDAVSYEIDSNKLALTIKRSDGITTTKILNLITGDEIIEGQPHTDTEIFRDSQNRRYKEILSSYDAQNNLLSKIETLYDVLTDSIYQITLYNPTTNEPTQISWYSSGVLTRQVNYDFSGQISLITVYNSSGDILKTYYASHIEDNVSLDEWFTYYQGTSGLIASHPDDTSFVYHEGTVADWAKIFGYTQAYTYDQALAGISFLTVNNFSQAKKIFDFYFTEFQSSPVFDGFWTVYNTEQDFQWKKYEWRKGMGESAWIGLFAMQYYAFASDPAEKAKALELATGIGKWISSLAHHNGGVAMGPSDQWALIYSTENNLDYYALSKILSEKALNPLDRQLFSTENTNLKNWLRNEAYNSATGLFNRGGRSLPGNGFEWDGLASLDVNSWAIQSIGPQILKNDFGISLEHFINKIQDSFLVQTDDSFGGDVFSARGFDFSDSLNAGLVGRGGVKWVEGTNQMIVSYRILADYYLSIGDLAKAQYYLALASYFQIQNVDNSLMVNSKIGYAYADKANLFIYFGNNTWKTTSGQAAPSSAWIAFALNQLNPLEN